MHAKEFSNLPSYKTFVSSYFWGILLRNALRKGKRKSAKILVGKKRFYKNGWSVKTLFGQKYLSPSQNLVTFYRRVFVPVRLIRCGINKENGLPPIIEKYLLYIFLIYLSLVNQKLKRVSSCLNKTIFKGSSG